MDSASFFLMMDHIILDNSRITQPKEMASIYMIMAAFIKDKFIKTKQKVKVNIMMHLKGIFIKAIGKMICHKVTANNIFKMAILNIIYNQNS